MARIVTADRAVDEAAALLQAGELVAIPTETVYGLAADAANGEAVARIFAVKGRPSFNPLIAHVADMEMAERIARFDPLSRRLAAAFWPGPLTLVLPRLSDALVHDLVCAGLDTVALRMPRGIARELSRRLGRPLAAPSANPSGRLSPTTAEAVEETLGSRIALIVDGGAAPVGLESTILRVEGDRIRILRPGAVTAADVEAVTGIRPDAAVDGEAIAAPGMLASHYAPRAALRLDADRVGPGEAALDFGATPLAGTPLARMNLSPGGDMFEAAANLYAHLRALDRTGAATIAVAHVPAEGLGLAINDRLRRAAAPRPGDA